MPLQADLFVPMSEVALAPVGPVAALKPVNWELRQGAWQEALGDVECDALIVDAPYSERTHGGQRHGRKDGSAGVASNGLGYAHWTAEDVHAFVSYWEPRTRGWFVSLTDSELYPAWRDALRGQRRVVFQPVPCVQVGMTVRLAGDGPSSWTCWAVVARNTALKKWGTLTGEYRGTPYDFGSKTRGNGVSGSKPLWLMRALVRDYSRPGDVVCDPCAGGGTTLLAAITEHRSAIGAEMDPKTFELAQRRLRRGYTPAMFLEEP